MGSHDHILRLLAETKQSETKSKLTDAVKALKEACSDLPAQDRYDLMSAIFDIEDIIARKPE